jgi:molecular chaperone GrpE
MDTKRDNLPTEMSPNPPSPRDEPQADGAGTTAPASQELEEIRDKYLRLAAEYENFRKRAQRERQDTWSRAQAELAKQFVDVLDDISRFAHIDMATVDPATVVSGVEMVERKLLKTLGAAGFQVVSPIDQAFDPALHEAVGTMPALSPEDDHVVGQVFQPGYTFNGQLLRPARVSVKQWAK